MSPRPRRAWSASITLLLACSTVREEDIGRGCELDSDCMDPDKVCNFSVCTESKLPPRGPIALDVRSDAIDDHPFRVEILGNDAGVTRILEKPNRYRVSLNNDGDTPGVRDRLIIGLSEQRMMPQEGEDPIADLPASFTLIQGSRLGRAALRRAGLGFPRLDPETKLPAEDPELELPWPHYESGDPGADLPLYIELSPLDDDEAKTPEGNKVYKRGIIYRQLVRKRLDGAFPHKFVVPSVRECHRRIDTSLHFPEGVPTLPPLAEGDLPFTASVTLRHAGRVADPADPDAPICDPNPADNTTPATCSPETILPQPDDECDTDNQCAEPYRCYTVPGESFKRCGCRADADCPSGQVCNIERQLCALDLTDRPASKTATPPFVDGDFSTWVYTYCDDDPTAGREMEFIIDVVPDGRLGLPRLTFRQPVEFSTTDGEPNDTPMAAICLPNWSPVQTIALKLQGQPAEIYRDAQQQRWICCDTACLTIGDDAPADVPKTCALQGSITSAGEFSLTPEQKAQWDGCLEPKTEVIRSAFQPGDCPADSPKCDIKLSAGNVVGEGQAYTLRVEPPVGSIFRSAFVDLTVTKETTEFSFPLPYRVLLRGSVKINKCVPDPKAGTTCTPPAEVIAERIIQGEGEASLLGPYYFTTTTLADTGEYVLPLNPGLYLLTAVPEITAERSQAAPAPITIVDVREDSSLVRLEGGLPVADIPELLLAPTGVVFTLEFSGFDDSTRVIPLDRTSWNNGGKGIAYEFTHYDLNDPSVCAKNEGCLIRRLRPGNSSVYLTQERFINYTARPD